MIYMKTSHWIYVNLRRTLVADQYAKEYIMSRSQHAVIETETSDFVVEAQVIEALAKPYLVSNAPQGADNVITRRVEAVLDAQFANGSMPA
jgi:hypothetical protein